MNDILLRPNFTALLSPVKYISDKQRDLLISLQNNIKINMSIKIFLLFSFSFAILGKPSKKIFELSKNHLDKKARRRLSPSLTF